MAQMQVNDWKLTTQDGYSEISLVKKPSVIAEASMLGGEQKILEVRKFSPKVVVIVYKAGISGTSVLVESTYGLLYNIESQKFLGDYPLRYKTQSDAPYTFEQPSWKVEGNSLKISDANSDIEVTIAL